MPPTTCSGLAMAPSFSLLFLPGSCAICLRVINLERGFPTVDEARRRLLAEMQAARAQKIRLLKVIHGYGSTGGEGRLCVAIRKSLRLRIKEGKALAIVPGEKFSSDSNEAREVLQRNPSLRRDSDLNRSNPGVTIVELAF